MAYPNRVVVFDFETTGVHLERLEAVELAAKAYDADSLEAIPDADAEFVSLMRPEDPDCLYTPEAQSAFRVNKQTPEAILKAPPQKAVWEDFCSWMKRWNPKTGVMTAPFAAGKNIRNFDLPIVAKMNARYGPKKDKTVLFYNRRILELEDFLLGWFWPLGSELPSLGMDDCRDYFGLSRAGAHQAMTDVRQTGTLIMYFLRLQRELRTKTTKEGGPLIRFKGALQGV